MLRSMCCIMSIIIALSTIVVSAEKKLLTNEYKAQALVEKGIAFIKANGKEKALAAFMDPKGGFIDGDLYLFADSYQGICLAHVNQKLLNTEQFDITDADGREIIKEFYNIATTKGSGWVEYKWANPTTKKIQEKKTYISNVEGMDFFIGCGFYK